MQSGLWMRWGVAVVATTIATGLSAALLLGKIPFPGGDSAPALVAVDAADENVEFVEDAAEPAADPAWTHEPPPEDEFVEVPEESETDITFVEPGGAEAELSMPEQDEADLPPARYQRPPEANPFEVEAEAPPVATARRYRVRNADFTPEDAAREEIRPIVDEVKTRAENVSASAGELPEAVRLREVQALIDKGDDVEAHKLLSKWYWEYPSARPAFQKSLDDLSDHLFFEPQPFYHPPYVVQSGDLLQKIASKHKLSWQYLSRVNKVDPKKIRAGQKLKVIQGPFSAVVDLSDFELTIHCRNRFVRRYRIGTGKGKTTPIGEFVVKEKLENPKYWGPNGDVREADDPLNPLGERWVDIGDGFGIHGTIEPDSIGKCESRGCIRMLNDDVAEVYDLLVIGSTVRIQK